VFDLSRIAKSGLVRHIDFHESLGSTNDRALELAPRDELPLPLLVLAQQQTAGRGRGTNRWASAPGALTFSLLLEAAEEELPPDARPRVALAAGLAVCEALEPLVPRADWRVKWPNDVYANGRKLCGILCEAAPSDSRRLVVGIGINVNNSPAAWGQWSGARIQGSEARSQETDELLRCAVALVDLDGLARDLTEVLLAVLDRFDLRWSELLAGQFAALAAAIRQRCLLTGKTATANAGGESLVGICRGIDSRGALVLATESGPRTVVAGSIDKWE
jgi:BirA family biotin operon repressor/biotin-[acetyl-CoA-carboxylase] ligase